MCLCCRCAAEYCGEARSRETGFPVAAGCHYIDRAGQGRGWNHHPCDAAWHVPWSQAWHLLKHSTTTTATTLLLTRSTSINKLQKGLLKRKFNLFLVTSNPPFHFNRTNLKLNEWCVCYGFIWFIIQSFYNFLFFFSASLNTDIVVFFVFLNNMQMFLSCLCLLPVA